MTTPARDADPFPAAYSWYLDNPLTRVLAGRFVRRIGVEPGLRVLDVGCGPGRLTLPLARAVGEAGEVVGVDVQDEMLARVAGRAAAAGLTNVRTVRAPAGEAGLEREEFDLAVLAYVLGEIPQALRRRALAEVAEALRPGGRVAVAEGVFDPHRQRVDQVAALAERSGLHVETVERRLLGVLIVLRR
jgi:ubiquinone/menaquinone biosynthesis C-methylase UbiE